MHVTRLRMSDPSRDGALTSHVPSQSKRSLPGSGKTTLPSKGSIEIKKLPLTNFAVVASILRRPRGPSQLCPRVRPPNGAEICINMRRAKRNE